MRDKTDAGWRRPVKEVNVQIGERCRKAREAAGYTQERLAEAVGKSTQFISDTERGICGMSINTIMSLCSALSVSADYLLFGWSEEGSSVLSMDTRISRLTDAERSIVEQQLNLIIQAFSVNSNNNE